MLFRAGKADKAGGTDKADMSLRVRRWRAKQSGGPCIPIPSVCPGRHPTGRNRSHLQSYSGSVHLFSR